MQYARSCLCWPRGVASAAVPCPQQVHQVTVAIAFAALAGPSTGPGVVVLAVAFAVATAFLLSLVKVFVLKSWT